MSSEHVGGPALIAEIRLVSDGEYKVTDTEHLGVPVKGRGEIWTRGPCVMQGYYNLPDKTMQTKTPDGWIKTGDIGAWLETDSGVVLKIIDRKSNIFKLAQGEFVAPERVENIVTRSEFVMQTFVHGSPLSSFLVAIVVVDPDVLMPWASRNSVGASSVEEVCRDPRANAEVLRSIQEVCRASGLRGYEIPKRVLLTAEPFTPQNVLTATMKLKRREARTFFKQELDQLYAADESE